MWIWLYEARLLVQFFHLVMNVSVNVNEEGVTTARQLIRQPLKQWQKVTSQ